MELPFTIQIPVFDETRALEFSSFYFDRMGLRPRYVLDTQRTPEAEATLRRLGHDPAFFENDKTFIESGYENFAAASPTDWILRMDCDEVPSPEVIGFCREFVRRDERGAAGFKRRELLWHDGRFLMTPLDETAVPNQRQWRLFNRKRVRFLPRIHTPGIEPESRVPAPPEIAFYHLSWVFLTWEERVQKTARYDAHGQPRPFAPASCSRLKARRGMRRTWGR